MYCTLTLCWKRSLERRPKTRTANDGPKKSKAGIILANVFRNGFDGRNGTEVTRVGIPLCVLRRRPPLTRCQNNKLTTPAAAASVAKQTPPAAKLEFRTADKTRALGLTLWRMSFDSTRYVSYCPRKCL